MAGSSIEGITIELNGDSTGLTTAIKGVQGALKDTQSDLRSVNKLLKMDPGNTELQAQKQRLLAKAITETKDKLKTLKEAAKQAQEQLNRGEISQAQYDALQREIIQTENDLKKLERQASKSAQAMEKMAASGEKWMKAGKKVEQAGKSLLPVTAAVTAAGTASVKTAAAFDTSMSQVQATLGITKDASSELNGETVNTMDSLRGLAKEMGSSTAFSASQAADAINYLALAGYDTQQIYDTLPTVLNLAAAGGMDLASASDMVTDAMSALGMDTSDAVVMVDQMAKTASSSNTSVAQLGDALLTLGATGKMVAGGTTEINTALGILANNGIKGAEGGTHLRNVIMSLTSPTDKAAKALKNAGVSVFDAEGNMRGMSDILGDLQNSMSDLTQAQQTDLLSTIFNKTDMAAVNALLANTGDAWDELSGKISDSGGAAQQMADTQLDNLGGQITILKSGIEGLAIAFGEKLMPHISKIIDWIQNLTNSLSSMDSSTMDTIVKVAGIAAVLGPLLIIVGKVITFIGMAKKAIAALNLAMMANPIVFIVAGIALLVAGFVLLWKKSEKFRNFWIGLWETIKSAAVSVWEAIKSAWSAIGDFFVGLWAGIVDTAVAAWDAVKAAWAAIGEWFSSKLDELLDLASKAKDLGSRIVENIKTGISNKWASLTSWFTNLFDSLFNRTAKIDVETSGGGGAALGLNYVPFSGYLAQLHKGEAVLTAGQAREWRDGQSRGSAQDSAAIISAINNLASSMNVNVSLEGDARGLFRQVQQQNNRVAKSTGYNPLGRSMA